MSGIVESSPARAGPPRVTEAPGQSFLETRKTYADIGNCAVAYFIDQHKDAPWRTAKDLAVEIVRQCNINMYTSDKEPFPRDPDQI